MDPALLRRADALARTDRFPDLIALLAVRHGRIVFEHYYRGFRGSYPVDLFSITKSVTSAAVGLAIADGRIHSVEEPLSRFFPGQLVGTPAETGRITLRQLLTMTAGYPGDAAGVPLALIGAPHPIHALLMRPRTVAQGQFAYDNGSSQLVADAVAKSERTPEAQLIRSRLFHPLGFVDDKSWPSDADGNTWGWAGLRLTARELAKIGYLYLHRGRWDGRQLIPAAWVADSTTGHIRFPRAYGYLVGYGYFWWRLRLAHQDGFAAIGFGGQELVVIPARDLIVIVGNFRTNTADPGPILKLLIAAAG